MGFWYIRSRISAAEKTRVFGVKGLFTPKTRVFFGCGNSAADISKPHTFKWGTLADDVFFVGELHAASKTSSANGSHLNVWDFDISAAEFPQQKKRADISKSHTFKWGPLADDVLDVAWNSLTGKNTKRPLLGPIHTKDARFFCCGNSAADISKPHTFKWDPLAEDVLEAAWSSPTEKTLNGAAKFHAWLDPRPTAN